MSDLMTRLGGVVLTLPLIATLPLSSCKGQETEVSPAARADRVILFIIDGLAKDAPERLSMLELQKLAKQGCRYDAMHLPLPGHPKDDPRYPWSCSMPNPMLMAGTPFIGVQRIRSSMIQHQFQPEETAFVVNAYSYKDVSEGFGVYLSDPHREDDIVIINTKRLLKESSPIFMRVHLQRAGIEGLKCTREKYADESWYRNIWASNSPYRKACLHADQLLGDFVSWLKAEDLWQGTVLLICGDHGQADEGWHEPYTASSSVTTLVIAGSGVVPGRKLEYCEIFDIAPTIAHLAGRPAPALAIGRVLKEAFDPGQQPPQVTENVSLFNQTLRAAQKRTPNQRSVLKQRGFQTMDDIGQWHTTEAGTDFPKFVRFQQDLETAF